MALPIQSSTKELSDQQDARFALVERVVGSQCLRGSARLREFLSYVADCVLRHAPEEATEQQIGIHVFGRMAGYNSSEDSIVRTHARLLRQKLTEYFAEEGADEPVVLEIPKGHYLPNFYARANAAHSRAGEVKPVVHVRTVSSSVLGEIASAAATKVAVPERMSWKHWNLQRWVIVTVALVGVVAGAGWLWARSVQQASAVERFWQPFLADNASLVIYSNALFTGDSTNGLKYAIPQSTQGSADQQDPQVGMPQENLVDTYTGVGELAGVYELTKLFDRHQASFTLKRSLLVTWDEAKLQNLIFVGSQAENLSLRDVPSMTDFTMTTGNGSSGIVNHHPQPGELPMYTVPLHSATKDYAILAYLPGVQPGKHMLVFSGLMTIGTQGAVDFTCHNATMEGLLAKATSRTGEVRPFEAVLETTIGGGVPLETRLVAVHVH